MRRRTVRLFLAGILVAGSLALGCQKKGEQQKVETTPFTGDPTTVVGKVGDDGILLGDVDKLVQMWKNGKAPGFEGMSDREIQRKALDQLIDQKVLLAASRKEGFAPDENQINEVMQTLAARFGSPEVFQQVLSQQGMTEADLRGNVAIDMAIRSYLEKAIPDTGKVTPEQAQAYYSANPDKFMAPEKIHARHILVKVDPAATPEQKEAGPNRRHRACSRRSRVALTSPRSPRSRPIARPRRRAGTWASSDGATWSRRSKTRHSTSSRGT